MTDLHPDQLQALASAWSLRSALAELGTAAAYERSGLLATARSRSLASRLQAWEPNAVGGSGGGGGHGDPTARVALDAADPFARPGRLARLGESVADTLYWLVGKLGLRTLVEPLPELRRGVLLMRPSTAVQLRLWLDEADTRIREAVQLPPTDRPVPGLACPSCGVRQLVDLGAPRVIAPAEPLPGVACRAGCRCAGESCTCRMPVRPAGAEHIWTRDSDLGRRAVVLVA